MKRWKYCIVAVCCLACSFPVFAQTTYVLSTSVVGNGWVSGDGTYFEGETVYVSALPGHGY